MRNRVALVALILGAVVLVTPAFGGTSLVTRVKRLEKRVNAIAQFVLLADKDASRKPYTVRATSLVGPGQTTTAEASCVGDEVLGGGADFSPAYAGDVLVASRPSLRGWFAAGTRGPTSAQTTFTVYAICRHYP